MAAAHHSRLESSFESPGSRYRKSLVHHVWQDAAATEREPMMKVTSMHGRVVGRSTRRSAVAGLHARASEAMILSTGPLKVKHDHRDLQHPSVTVLQKSYMRGSCMEKPLYQMQDQDRKHNDLYERLAHSSVRSLKLPAQITEPLHGHCLKVHRAAPSQTPGCQHRPLSGSAHGSVFTLQSPSLQRPHTAPATERKFRGHSQLARQRSGVDKTPSVAGLAEQLSGDAAGRPLAAAGQSSALILRPATPPSTSPTKALGPTWQRRLRGATAPGDLSERRAGRSLSTEPMLLHQQPGIAASWSREVQAIPDVIGKGPGRPRMKAPVDCWWDERQPSKVTPSRSGSPFGNLGTNQVGASCTCLP